MQISSKFADEPEAYVNKYKLRPANNAQTLVHNFPVYTQQKFGGQPTWQRVTATLPNTKSHCKGQTLYVPNIFF